MSKGTEKQFGYAWDIYREILPLHRRQFEQWIQPFPISAFKGKRFLDAGCGIGRNSLWALEAGAASGYAFDYDERTIAVAERNLKRFPNCRVGFESIYEIAYEREFDTVFCIGVIHHLEDPRSAVENLVRALRPGGTLIIWVYAREGNERYLLFEEPLRRYLTSRIHPLVTRYLSMGLTALLRAYLVLPHSNPYLKELKQRSFRHTEAMVFDQLIPRISRYFAREELCDLVSGLPLNVRHLTHTNGMSWTMIAERSV